MGCGHPAEAVPGCSECRRTWPGETAERLADRGGVDLLGPRERRQSGAPQVKPQRDANTKNVIRRRGARGLLEKKRSMATRVCASGWGTRLEAVCGQCERWLQGQPPRERRGAQRDWVQWFELWKDPCRGGAWQVLCESRAGSAQGTFLIQSLES